MRFADGAVICAYFLALPTLSLALSRRGRSGRDADRGFLSAAHDLPWWAICLSLVATETSTLTFISVPGVGYTSGMVFLGLAGGYFLGRTIVAIWFLPRFAGGRMVSVYQYLGQRFGTSLQQTASGAFLITRLLAEGVRLSAGLLPLMWMLHHDGLNISRAAVLGVVMLFTLGYTLLGGLRAVVWSDTIQLTIYLLGAVLCVILLEHALPPSSWSEAWAHGRLALFHPLHGDNFLSDAFTVPAALIGGAILSVASHGTDQLMVQRLLAARTLRDARLALLGSAFVVALLFGLLSLLGVQLWIRDGGAALSSLGLHTPDDIFPNFIVSDLPAGLCGLLLAGVLSATMGSLSSTINAMAGAVLTDFGPRPRLWLEKLRTGSLRQGAASTPTTASTESLFAPRILTAFWSIALMSTALLFSQTSQSAVVVGLTIAGWSYGPTLGVFLFGMLVPAASARDALTGFVLSLAGMGLIMALLQMRGWHVAFPWLVPMGIILMMITGTLNCLRRRTASNPSAGNRPHAP